MPPLPTFMIVDTDALHYNDDRCTPESVSTTDPYHLHTRSSCVGRPSGDELAQETSSVEVSIPGTSFALYGSADGSVRYSYSVDGAPRQEATFDNISTGTRTGVKKLWSIDHFDQPSPSHTVSFTPLSGCFAVDYITYTPHPGQQPSPDPEELLAATRVTGRNADMLSPTHPLSRRTILSSSDDGNGQRGFSTGTMVGLIGGALGLILILWLVKVFRSQNARANSPPSIQPRTTALRNLAFRHPAVPPAAILLPANPADSTVLTVPPPSYSVPNVTITAQAFTILPTLPGSPPPPPHTPPVAPGQPPPPYAPPALTASEGRVG